MTKKSRVKNDAFDWVDNAKEKEQAVEQPMPTRTERTASSKAVKTESDSAKTKYEATTNDQRIIALIYKNETGDIMVSQELMFDKEGKGNISWSAIANDMTVKIFKLTGKLTDKKILEIHRNYKVTESGELVLKNQ
jgi:hypothetical protein